MIKTNGKKILYLTSYYKPEIAASLYIFDNIREGLIKSGYEIVVIAPTPSRGVSKEIRKEYKKNKIDNEYDGKLKVIRFKMFAEKKNVILRIIRYFYAHLKHYLIAKKINGVDLLIVSSTPPTQPIVALLLKRNKNVPVIYLLQDIFPKSLHNVKGLKKSKLIWNIGLKIEKHSYKMADKIICISQDFKNHLLSKQVPESKIEVVYNWVEENKVKYVKRETNFLFDKYNLDRNKFYLTYSGNIGLSQNFEILLYAADKLRANENIFFIIIGTGAYENKLIKIIEKMKLKNVIHLPFQDYKHIAEVFSLGNVGLILSKSDVSYMSVPSKTWSIMSASVPILACFDMQSEIAKIITKNKIGFCVEPYEYDKFYKYVIYMYQHREEILKYGENGRKYILNNLTKKIGVNKYIDIIDSILIN